MKISTSPTSPSSLTEARIVPSVHQTRQTAADVTAGCGCNGLVQAAGCGLSDCDQCGVAEMFGTEVGVSGGGGETPIFSLTDAKLLMASSYATFARILETAKMVFLNAHFSELLSFAAGLLSGSLLTIGINSYRSITSNAKNVNQRGASAGGDVVGGSKTTIDSR